MRKYDAVIKMYGLRETMSWLVEKANLSGKKANFKKIILFGKNLSFMDFSNADFSYSSLIGCNFQSSIFSNAKLYNCFCEGTDFSDCIMMNTDLRLSCFKKGTFERSYAYNAKFENQTFDDVNIDNAYFYNTSYKKNIKYFISNLIFSIIKTIRKFTKGKRNGKKINRSKKGRKSNARIRSR